MAFRRITYLISSCDGCGLAWSFGDPACAEGIPPHFASRAAALAQLPADYGWQVRRRRAGRPLMACRRCAAAGRIRRLMASGPVRRPVPAGLVPGHPESLTAVLPAEQEGLLAALDAEIFPDQR
jgi:hypothetical protein